jgi:hypothetical protein
LSNVGIGTTSPTRKLHISGDTQTNSLMLGVYLYMPNADGDWISTIDRSGSSPIFGYG